MKVTNWIDCLKNFSSLKVTPDSAKAKSLIETAKGRIKYVKEKELNEETACYTFENYYSSLLELLHSLVILEGYKVNNHICLGFYLRDILKRDDLYRIFDDCRFKRNSLIYYGKKLDLEDSKDAIKKIIYLTKELENLIKKTDF